MNDILRFRIAIQTMKEYWKTSIIITLLFVMMTFMYAGMFPQFEESLLEMMQAGVLEDYTFMAHADQMHTYIGFLTLELYDIFLLMILAIMIGFVAASSITKEIEGKTIDILMSNPISRKQIVFEKFIGLIPMLLIINFFIMFSVMGVTAAIDQELDFVNLFLLHCILILYFLAIVSIGILVSVVFNEKMKASIIMIIFPFAMFFINSISLMTPDIEYAKSFTMFNYLDSFSVLKFGEVDIAGVWVFIAIISTCLTISLIYFEHKDIQV